VGIYTVLTDTVRECVNCMGLRPRSFFSGSPFLNFALQKPCVSERLFSGLGNDYRTERSTQIFMKLLASFSLIVETQRNV
jgi:hypothetical protein